MGNQTPRQSPQREVRVVMVGGGHANVQVLRFLAERLSSLIVRPSSSSSSSSFSSSRSEGEERKGVRLVMVSDQKKAFYSGMLPGALAGLYTPSQISIDLPSLCLWSGAEFVCERVEAIDREKGEVVTSSGSRIPFDLLSLDVGSTSLGMEREGVRENVIATRPLSMLLEKVKDLKDRDPPPRRIVVVGSGAAGLELSWAFRTLFTSLGPSRSSVSSGSSSGSQPKQKEVEVVLVHRSKESPMADRGQKTVDNVKIKLGGRRIRVLSDREAIGIRTSSSSSSSSSHSDQARDQPRDQPTDQAEEGREREWAMWLRTRGEGGEEEIGSDVVVWATGAGAHEWMGNTGLALDEEGFVLVSSTLQALNDWRIFAAGDCNSFSPDADPEDESLLLSLSNVLDDLPSPLALRLDADHPVPASPSRAPPATHEATRRGLPKAGVYAVRQGPIVAENLLRLCNALLFADRSFSSSAEAPAVPLVPYVPQTTFLALLNTCDGEAISSWYQTSAVGRWVMRLKDYIDRKFMDRFNASLLGPSPVPAASARK